MLTSVGLYAWQPSQPQSALAERAKEEFLKHQYAAAERDFREVSQVDPSNIQAHLYLGHALFKQEKYPEAIAPYEKALALEQQQKKRLSKTDVRVLTDQLVMAYGSSGLLKKAHALLDSAIKQDPDYPLNYYNRACAFAEESDKPGMLAALRSAFERKQNVLIGEQLPDPRADSSFVKYLRDANFTELMKELGFK